MKIERVNSSNVQVRFSRRDLVFINDILNEVCHGFKVPEFADRIGATREGALRLLRIVHDLAASMPAQGEEAPVRLTEARTEPVVELTRGELTAIKNALHETLRELGVEEFDTRVGVSFEEGQAVLAKLDELLRAADQSG